MRELTPSNSDKVRELFAPEYHEEVAKLLEHECGTNLPFKADASAEELERIRLAVLLISKGDVGRLKRAVETAKVDWRDVLMVFYTKPID